MLLLKRIVLHLSMAFCLTGYVCQLAFVRAREKKKTREGKEEESFALPDAHLPLRRDKRKSQRVQGRKINPPLSSPHLPSLYCSLAWQIYIVRSFKAGVKRTYCGFQILRLPGEQLNEQNPKKSHLLRRSKTRKIPRQPVSC